MTAPALDISTRTPQHRRPGERVLRGEGGFTLVELLVAILIIGVLAAIAVPSFINQRYKGQDAAAKTYVRAAATAEEAYFVDKEKYTNNFSDLTAIEPVLNNLPDGTTQPVFSNVTDSTYTITVTSKSGNTFTVARATNGGMTRTCATGSSSAGGCTGGSW